MPYPKFHDLGKTLIIISINIQNYKHSLFFFVWLCHNCFFKILRFPMLKDQPSIPTSHLCDIAFVQNLKFLQLTGIPIFRYSICTKIIKTNSYNQVRHFRGSFGWHFNCLFLVNKEKITWITLYRYNNNYHNQLGYKNVTK